MLCKDKLMWKEVSQLAITDCDPLSNAFNSFNFIIILISSHEPGTQKVFIWCLFDESISTTTPPAYIYIYIYIYIYYIYIIFYNIYIYINNIILSKQTCQLHLTLAWSRSWKRKSCWQTPWSWGTRQTSGARCPAWQKPIAEQTRRRGRSREGRSGKCTAGRDTPGEMDDGKKPQTLMGTPSCLGKLSLLYSTAAIGMFENDVIMMTILQLVTYCCNLIFNFYLF